MDARTICAPERRIELCSNYVVPRPTAPGQPTPPPVVSTKPIAAGHIDDLVDGSAAQGLPQGPQPPPSEAAAGTQLPPGAVPLGPNGAPAPGATAPPTTGAPPATGAPPGDRRAARDAAP